VLTNSMTMGGRVCLCYAVVSYFAFYNLCRVHASLRVTPCMQAGLADHVWAIRELLEATA